MVVWKPKYPVLIGDFQWLFNWLRVNPFKEAPDMVIPEVVYPSEVAAPIPPKNLAEILQALENEDYVIPDPEYVEDASESDSDVEMEDAENHFSEDSLVQENQDDVLTLDAAAGNAIPLNDSHASSSTEPSILVNAIVDRPFGPYPSVG